MELNCELEQFHFLSEKKMQLKIDGRKEHFWLTVTCAMRTCLFYCLSPTSLDNQRVGGIHWVRRCLSHGSLAQWRYTVNVLFVHVIARKLLVDLLQMV